MNTEEFIVFHIEFFRNLADCEKVIADNLFDAIYDNVPQDTLDGLYRKWSTSHIVKLDYKKLEGTDFVILDGDEELYIVGRKCKQFIYATAFECVIDGGNSILYDDNMRLIYRTHHMENFTIELKDKWEYAK